MKRTFSIIVFFAILVTIVNSCEKNSFKITERTRPEGKALVKVGMFNAYTLTAPVRISINGAFVSNEIVHPVAYPGGGLNVNGSLNSDYLQLDPGNSTFQFFVMNTGTPVPASKLFETSQTLEANKRFTLYVTDTSQNTSAVLVNDDTPAPDSGLVRVKFVNLTPNLAGLDVYKGTNATSAVLLIGNVAYKGVSDYINIPAGTDSFFVRPAGSPMTTVPVARRGFTFSNQRIYTLLSRGYNGMTTGNRAANLSAIINQ